MQLAKWVLRFEGGRIEPRRREYWSWMTMALFLLTTVDLVTTTFATYRFGVNGEANPLVREALVLGPVFFVTINLVAVVVVTFAVR